MSDVARLHQLDSRIKRAKDTGFTEDVEHWSVEREALLAKLEEAVGV